MNDPIIRLQHWYTSRWPDGSQTRPSISIRTLDNPGWIMELALSQTPLAEATFASFDDLAPDEAWITCGVENGLFRGVGGARMLGTIVRTFVEWAEPEGRDRGSRAEPPPGPSLTQRLEDWYASQCDGEWEQARGLTILSTPSGWRAEIDLAGTPLSGLELGQLLEQSGLADGIAARREDELLIVECGSDQLESSLRAFLDLADETAARTSDEPTQKSTQTCPIEELLAPYLALLDALLERRISVEAFERFYLDAFLAETNTIPREPFEILNELFGDVDAYCGEDELYRPGIDLNEQELRDRCQHAVACLLAYQARGR